MIALLQAILARPEIDRLGWALLHFVWEGAAIAGLLGLALKGISERNSQARYLLSCLALAAMPVCLAATYFSLSPAGDISFSNPAAVSTSMTGLHDLSLAHYQAVETTVPFSFQDRVRAVIGALDRHMPWIVAGWMAGVIALAIRAMGGLMVIRRMGRRGVTEPEAALATMFARMCRRMEVESARVRLRVSTFVRVPLTMGWWKPVVLFPAYLLTNLGTEEIELILAHELAHVRRRDYLINVLQTLVETALFYHPAVWWVSGRIRISREHCCDDLTAQRPEEILTYARALELIETLRQSPPLLAQAIGGHGHDLLARIRRMVERTGGAGRPGGARTVGGLIAIMALAGLALMVRAEAMKPDATREIIEVGLGPAEDQIDALRTAKISDITTQTLTLQKPYPSKVAWTTWPPRLSLEEATKIAEKTLAKAGFQTHVSKVVMQRLPDGEFCYAAFYPPPHSEGNVPEPALQAQGLVPWKARPVGYLRIKMDGTVSFQQAEMTLTGKIDHPTAPAPAGQKAVPDSPQKTVTMASPFALVPASGGIDSKQAEISVAINGNGQIYINKDTPTSNEAALRELRQLGAQPHGVSWVMFDDHAPREKCVQLLDDLRTCGFHRIMLKWTMVDPPTDEVLATVNGVPVRRVLRENLAPVFSGINLAGVPGGTDSEKEIDRIRRQILDLYIDRELIIQDFKSSGKFIPDDYVDKYLKDIVEHEYQGDAVAFARTLASREMTLEEYRDEIADNAIVGYMREKKLQEVPKDLSDADRETAATTIINGWLASLRSQATIEVAK
jgi:beta-lactamase regulating signal transducer with metallopeptidase domain/biopolymer transport protein ExbD